MGIRKGPGDFSSPRLAAFDAAWQTRALPSGLTLLHAPLPHDDRFFLGVTVKAGSRLESGTHLSGVSHFLEHMMFRGSSAYPEFARLAEAFEWLGGEWNAATGHEHTEYWYSGIRHTAPEIIEMFADFLETPQLTDIEVERNIILRELDGETNDHGHSTDLDHHVASLIWPGTTIAQPILGTRESLAKIDVESLRRYRDAFYVPQNMVVAAVGGDGSVLPILEKHFASHRRALAPKAKVEYPSLPAFKGPAVKWIEHSDNEYDVKLSFLCGGGWSPDAHAYELITRILADGFCSRLARRLREELGLVYDISSGTSLGLDAGTLDVTALCAAGTGLDEFLKELFLLLKSSSRRRVPTADELDRAIVRSVVDAELSPAVPEAIGTKLVLGEARRPPPVARRGAGADQGGDARIDQQPLPHLAAAGKRRARRPRPSRQGPRKAVEEGSHPGAGINVRSDRGHIRINPGEALGVTIEGASMILALSGGQILPTPLPAINISRSGMFLKANWFLAKDAAFRFSLNLPKEEVINGSGRVAWVRTTTKGPLLPSGRGVEITAFDGDDEYRFYRYLESCAS